MKNFFSLLVISILIVVAVSCTDTSPSQGIETALYEGSFAFTDYKGVYQVYSVSNDTANLFAEVKLVDAIGISEESLLLSGSIGSDGSFSLTKSASRGIEEGEGIEITGMSDTGVEGVEDSDETALFNSLDSAEAFTIRAIGWEAFTIADDTVLYTGAEAPTSATAVPVQNHSFTLTVNTVDNTTENLSVYTGSDPVQYIKQQGVYDPDTKTIAVGGGVFCTVDGTPIAGSDFTLPQDIEVTINADGSVTTGWFWTGFSWNREEGYVEFQE